MKHKFPEITKEEQEKRKEQIHNRLKKSILEWEIFESDESMKDISIGGYYKKIGSDLHLRMLNGDKKVITNHYKNEEKYGN